MGILKKSHTAASNYYQSTASDFYQYRVSYLDEIFEKLSEKLLMSDEDTILDIACGNGQVSIGLSPFIGQSYALDFSEEMLSQAQKCEKINYIQHDLNDTPYQAPAPIDHIVIGRAIHWLDRKNLAKTVNMNLKEGGAIVTLGAGWDRSNPWLRAYKDALKGYSARKKSDLMGGKKLGKIGFAIDEHVEAKKKISLPLKAIINYCLSFSSQHHQIMKDYENFTEKMSTALRPWMSSTEHLEVTIVSRAIIYKRSQVDPGIFSFIKKALRN